MNDDVLGELSVQFSLRKGFALTAACIWLRKMMARKIDVKYVNLQPNMRQSGQEKREGILCLVVSSYTLFGEA